MTTTPKKKAIIRRVKTREVSLVDKGAVKRTFCLQKNEEGFMQKQILEACLNTPLEDEAAIDAALLKAETDPKAAEAVKAALRLLTAYRDELKPPDLDVLAQLLDMGVAPEDASEPEAAAVAAAQEEEKAAAKPAEEAQKAAQPTEQAMPQLEQDPRFEALSKAHAAAEERLNKLQKALEEKEQADKLRECVAKAQKDFAHLGPADSIGNLLMRLESAGLAKEAEEVLRGANARAEAAGLFKEYGQGPHLTRTDGEGPAAELARHAEKISQKENVPFAKAHVMACEQHPELYEAADKTKAQGGR